MIPHIIHQVWIGRRHPPPRRYLETWERLADATGWEYRLWTDDNLPELEFTQSTYDEWDHIHARGNLLAYEVLHRYGGVYFDADYVSTGRDLAQAIPLQGRLVGTTEHGPLVERRLGKMYNPRVGDEIEMAIVLQPGFLACEQGHPQLRYWLEMSRSVYDGTRAKGLPYWIVRDPRVLRHGWRRVLGSSQITGAFHLSRHLVHPITLIPFQRLLQGEHSIARYFTHYPHQLTEDRLDWMFEMMARGEPNSVIARGL